MQSLADRTGGRLIEINRLEYMAQLYREVAANLRTLYTVAYQAPGDRPRGKWHEIRVEVAHPELTAHQAGLLRALAARGLGWTIRAPFYYFALSPYYYELRTRSSAG